MPKKPVQLIALVLASLVGCSGSPAPRPHKSPAPPADTPLEASQTSLLTRKLSDGDLVFPPAEDRPGTQRPELELADKPTTTQLEVVAPDANFYVSGQSFQVYFNAEVADAAPGRPAGDLISITPSVVGQARWRDARTLEFVASTPFDPSLKYDVQLKGIRPKPTDQPNARHSETALQWQAQFTASGPELAGKAIGYLPEAGHERVVALSVSDRELVGRQPKLLVLYDQPVSLNFARRSIQLRRPVGSAVPIRLTHAHRSDFRGYRVPRGHLIEVTPHGQLAPGEQVELIAKHHSEHSLKEPGLDAKVEVASGLVQRGVWCDYGSTACSLKADGTLLIDQRRVTLGFNHPLSMQHSLLQRSVHISPRVANFSANLYNDYDSGKLVLRGDFRPGTTYHATLTRLTDRYQNTLSTPVRLKLRQRPLAASVSMVEGPLWLDDQQLRNFQFVSRNVDRAQLWLWQVNTDNEQTRTLLSDRRQRPAGSPFSVLPIDVVPKLDEFVTSSVDLSRALAPHQTYYVELRHSGQAFDAAPARYAHNTAAGRPPAALVTPGGQDTLAVHVHNSRDRTLVHVEEAASGRPVYGAKVRWASDAQAKVRTNANGITLLQASGANDGWLRVEAGQHQLLVPTSQRWGRSAQLFPELTTPEAPTSPERVAWNSDRGVYRPGETLHLKASVFQQSPAGLSPLASRSLRLVVKGPMGRKVFDKTQVTSSYGSLAADIELPKDATTGNYQSELYLDERKLSQHAVRVSAFTAPRFVVDIAAPQAQRAKAFKAKLHARYLFGAPLSAATANWSLTTAAGEVPKGPLTELGLSFKPANIPHGEAPHFDHTRTGSEHLGSDGNLHLELPLLVEGALTPVLATLQAEVVDESYRSAAARHVSLFHPFERYAGLHLDRGWFPEQEAFEVSLGVADQYGNSVAGARVLAVLEKLSSKVVTERAADGSLQRRWRPQRQRVASCSTTSQQSLASCSLTPKTAGTHLLTAWVDGHPGGSRQIWVSGASGARSTPDPAAADRLTLVPDKDSYQPGESAKVLVENPFAQATALTTLEGASGLLEHRVQTLQQGHSILEFSLKSEHTPFVHATVALLPTGKGQRPQAPLLGAVRLPVEMSGARLELAIETDKQRYRPGEGASIDLTVTHQGHPARDVELAIAVVDEGVLRLTNFRAPDPAQDLWRGVGLQFDFFDTRSTWSEAMAKSHVAGDGGEFSQEEDLITRDNFVHTALWKPQLNTDTDGRTHVALDLPDNLTEFRVLAVALDRQGRSATAEHSFQVTQEVLLDPLLPRFSRVGDQFEVGVMLHNTSRQPFRGQLDLLGSRHAVRLSAGERRRVATPMRPTSPGKHKLRFALRDSQGHIVDQVERPLHVNLPGAEQRPRLAGSFTKTQHISLQIPEDARSGDDSDLRLVVGENLHPELGSQLEFLLGYPHGCVEQTTSSTLPLVAARTILPLLGMAARDPNFFDERIRHGLERLNTMRTSTGGLAYWPGGTEPSVFGTAYAMRAVVASRKLGIQAPAGMDSTMLDYLREQLARDEVVPEVRSAIALSLAESGRLQDSDADRLFDLAQDAGVFGKANVALALDKLKAQDDRVTQLVSEIEAALVADEPLSPRNREDLHSFSSDTRALAQASLALHHLKPRSERLPPAVRELLALDQGYTTQATSYRLLALAEHVATASSAATQQRVSLDGQALSPSRELAGGAREYRISLKQLIGKTRELRLQGPVGRQLAFALDTSYSLPRNHTTAPASAASAELPTLAAVTAASGAHLYRMFTTPEGEPVDLSAVEAGSVLRVALLVRRPKRLSERAFRYLAISDKLPAGFEPVDTSLDTVAQANALSNAHPLYDHLLSSRHNLSHMDLRDDVVHLYFDAPPSEEAAASYLVRATTPGSFELPRASAELMYEPDSVSFSESARVVVK